MYFIFKLIWLPALTAVFIEETAVDTDPLKMVDTFSESAKILMDMIYKYRDALVAPAIKAADDRIKWINTNIKGITEEEKDLVRIAKQHSTISKNEYKSITILLKSFAEETIFRAGELKYVIHKLDVDLSGQQQKSDKNH